jgi:pimeloyl-ACP methyl ester carboxylesterase
MIRWTVFNKSKPKTLLLVHGLFTSAGYWLPYLKSLKDYRLLIPDIDYRGIRDVDAYLGRIDEIISEQAGGKVEAVIAHSLGCLLASLLPQEARGASFEVCPVYCAARREQDEFVSEIERKMRSTLSQDGIRALLAEVDDAIDAHRLRAQARKTRAIYLPDADRYFSYQKSHDARWFSGDHFEITEAVADIGSKLTA